MLVKISLYCNLLTKTMLVYSRIKKTTQRFKSLVIDFSNVSTKNNTDNYWLDSVELAIERSKNRVSKGGHNIPADTIIRRYYAGIKNFLKLYKKKKLLDVNW